MKKTIAAVLTAMLVLLVISCANNDDLPISDLQPVNGTLDPQDFIWKSLNLWYFWQNDVPDLRDSRFSSNAEYTDFLQNNPDPQQFFEDLNFSGDRFSTYFADNQDLFNFFNGVDSKSNGVVFSLVSYNEGNNLFAYVRYIMPDSDASDKDIRRGDFIWKVDGEFLTPSNYVQLLFEGNDTYTAELATIDPQTNIISGNGRNVSLTKQINVLENPILKSNTLDVAGTKVGYLAYNGFNETFDEQLNEVFGQFVADGVTELVLDLRYNGGGNVNTSRLLASMIYTTNTNEVFIRQRYNPKIEQAFNSTRFFAATTRASTPINTLNLTRIFILTTFRTASASELVINGLTPYIEVVQIGDVTRGKNESALPLVDDPEGDYVWDPTREDQINPNSPMGLYVMIGRAENSAGFSDYTDGLEPDITLTEDILNLGVLGDPSEPLLAAALNIIAPATRQPVSIPLWPAEKEYFKLEDASLNISWLDAQDLRDNKISDPAPLN